MRARTEIAGLERGGESLDRLAVRHLEQLVLALADRDQPAQVSHDGRILAACCLVERVDPEQALEQAQQLQRIERLGEESLGADGERRDAGLARAADDDDRHVAGARALAQPLAVEEAVDTWKADVEHDRVGKLGGNDLLGLDDVTRFAHLDPLELERRSKQFAKQWIVVDDQNRRLRLPHDPFCIGGNVSER